MRSCSRSLAGVCATVRAGLAGAVAAGEAVSNRPILPHADSVKAAHNSAGAAQRRRPVLPSRHPERSVNSATRSVDALIPAEHFNLPHPEHLDPWPTSRLDIAANTNPSIFEGFRPKPGRLERRYHAP